MDQSFCVIYHVMVISVSIAVNAMFLGEYTLKQH